MKYLSKFGLADAFLETNFFTKFSTRTHMLLAANTLQNLEIYRNETDYTTRGSLMWILDRTKTRFGARLLRYWVGRPLVDKVYVRIKSFLYKSLKTFDSALQQRIDAVEEILASSSEKLVSLRQLLKGLPDLAKGLCRIHYGQVMICRFSHVLSSDPDVFSVLLKNWRYLCAPSKKLLTP